MTLLGTICLSQAWETGAQTSQLNQLAALEWNQAWVRSMPLGANVAAAYGSLTNHGSQSVTITGVRSSLGTEAQLHKSVTRNEQQQMVHLHTIELDAGKTLTFAPGKHHIMMSGITTEVSEGSQVQLCVEHNRGSPICTFAPVTREAPSEVHLHNVHH